MSLLQLFGLKTLPREKCRALVAFKTESQTFLIGSFENQRLHGRHQLLWFFEDADFQIHFQRLHFKSGTLGPVGPRHVCSISAYDSFCREVWFFHRSSRPFAAYLGHALQHSASSAVVQISLGADVHGETRHLEAITFRSRESGPAALMLLQV